MLSVVIPNYNHGKYLSQSLDAVLAQTVQPLEIIVVDDASTDNSVEIVEMYLRKASHVRLLRRATNGGVNIALNQAFLEARGEYIVSIAADDLPRPQYFEKSLAMLKQYPQAALCCSLQTDFDDARGTYSVHPRSWGNEPRYFGPLEFAQVLNGEYIAGNTSIKKKASFYKAGMFLLDNKWHADWFFLLVMAFREGVCFIPESLNASRVDHSSYSLKGIRDKEQQRGVLTNIIKLLCSEAYCDVLPHFMVSKAMNHFGPFLAEVIMTNSQLWDPRILLLCNAALHKHAQASMSPSEQADLEKQKLYASCVAASIARSEVRNGRAAEAVDILVKVLNSTPTYLDAYIDLSKALCALHRLTDARNILIQALRLSPNSSGLLAEIGKTELLLGQFDEARRYFVKALDIDPTTPGAREGLQSIHIPSQPAQLEMPPFNS
jgi:glycosyltransferase involved in cell wall biosynthesis/Tfp pilus assembly protein PilF